MPKPPETLISMVWRYAPITGCTVASISVALIVLGFCIMYCPKFHRYAVIFPTLSLLPFLASLALGFQRTAHLLSIIGSSGTSLLSPQQLIFFNVSTGMVVIIAASIVSAVLFLWSIILFIRVRPVQNGIPMS